MNISDKFKWYFSEENLKEVFVDHIIYSRATGIDNLDQYAFRSQLDEQVEILSRKVISGNYTFTKYKLKLISKGRGKLPREISIPTVRDRIALRTLCGFISEIFKDSVGFDLPQNVVRKVKADIESNRYEACIKLDVVNFYPSVKHAELISRLGRKIRNQNIKRIIASAISSPTVSVSRPSDLRLERGIPQGLAVSNILAAIYLSNIDKNLRSIEGVKYYRYVDDVLIFCSLKDAYKIIDLVVGKFKRVGLKIHDPKKFPEKSSIGPISDGFEYLGYKFSPNLVTARAASVERLKESLVSIFTSYKYSKRKSKGFLLWRLNLRITGCIYENKSKGWLFFFSEISDESLLHTLDHYVKRLSGRFEVNVKPKKFVRAFKELTHRKYETNYIPNFDRYDIEQKGRVLVDYFELDIGKLEEDEINFEFKKRLSRQVKDLQTDVMDFS
ncbi:reverse transcriptase domain-containing protein [Microbulbifer sp. ZKSA002]|uniref:reverse transcriptase domain-containing protein n=1 Tax=Microbulbifer sp. ZKSA002 TaxID=3243388 RepID=UPI00403A2F50